MQNNTIYIIGCGGHARSVADVVLDNNPSQNLIFIDENTKKNEKIFGFPIIKKLPQNAKNIFIAIGNNNKRKILSQNKKLINIISKRSYISPTAKLSDGIFIGDGVHIGPMVEIGRGTIINTNAIIEHENIIKEFSHISVNSTVCGRVKIGDNVFLGAGATVKDGIIICDNTTIGAGGVVVKDITETGIYTGIPVKRKVK